MYGTVRHSRLSHFRVNISAEFSLAKVRKIAELLQETKLVFQLGASDEHAKLDFYLGSILQNSISAKKNFWQISTLKIVIDNERGLLGVFKVF
jgi:hypothetical protein